jgi:hypothetical protein
VQRQQVAVAADDQIRLCREGQSEKLVIQRITAGGPDGVTIFLGWCEEMAIAADEPDELLTLRPRQVAVELRAAENPFQLSQRLGAGAKVPGGKGFCECAVRNGLEPQRRADERAGVEHDAAAHRV